MRWVWVILGVFIVIVGSSLVSASKLDDIKNFGNNLTMWLSTGSLNASFNTVWANTLNVITTNTTYVNNTYSTGNVTAQCFNFTDGTFQCTKATTPDLSPYMPYSSWNSTNTSYQVINTDYNTTGWGNFSNLLVTGTGTFGNLNVTGTAVSVSNPTGASGTTHLDNTNGLIWDDESSEHRIRVYAYKIANGNKIFSTSYSESNLITFDGSGMGDLYYITWSWTAVTGADGYRILRYRTTAGFGVYNYNYYYDTAGITFNDYYVGGMTWTAGNVTTPTSGYSNAIALNGLVNVGGDMNITGDYKIGGNKIISTLGTNNILVGNAAPSFSSIGSENVFVGSQAGNSMISGADNVLVGYQAGKSYTGSYLTAIGAYAGAASTVDGVFIGYQAGKSITTGTFNTIIGKGAYASATTAQNVIAIGDSAGAASNAGNNIFIGAGVGSGSTGGGNVLIGPNAALQLTTGTNNVGFGSTVFPKLTIGGSNIAIGNNAGENMINGSNNIILGVGVNGPATASNVLIFGTGGSQADVAKTVSFSGQVADANSIVFGNGAGGFTYTDFYGGAGTTYSSTSAFTVHATGGSGSNKAGSALNIAGGKGTGNAVSGVVAFQTSDALGSGSTLQSLTTKWTINQTGSLLAGTDGTGAYNIKTAGNYSFSNGWTIQNATDGRLIFWNATAITAYLDWRTGTWYTHALGSFSPLIFVNSTGEQILMINESGIYGNDKNVTASYFIGDGSRLTGVQAEPGPETDPYWTAAKGNYTVNATITNLTNWIITVNATNGQGGAAAARTLYSVGGAKTTNATGLPWVTLFTIPMSANTNYTLDCYLMVSSNATTSGIRWNMTLPGVPDWQATTSQTTLTAAGTAQYGGCDGALLGCMPTAVTASSVFPAAMPAQFHSFIDGNANTGGNLLFQFSGELAALAAYVHRGSYCELKTA